MRKHLDAGVRHADKGQARKRRWTDGDEHSRSRVWQGQAVRHQPADVVAVHEDGDKYAETLEGGSGYEDRGCVSWGLGSCYYGSDGSGEHDWEDGQDPRGRHLRFLESVILIWDEREAVKQRRLVRSILNMSQNRKRGTDSERMTPWVYVLECRVKGLPVKRR